MRNFFSAPEMIWVSLHEQNTRWSGGRCTHRTLTVTKILPWINPLFRQPSRVQLWWCNIRHYFLQSQTTTEVHALMFRTICQSYCLYSMIPTCLPLLIGERVVSGQPGWDSGDGVRSLTGCLLLRLRLVLLLGNLLNRNTISCVKPRRVVG